MSDLTNRRSALRASAASAFAWVASQSNGIRPGAVEAREVETVDDAIQGEWPMVVPVLLGGNRFAMNLYSPAAWANIPPDDRADYVEDRVEAFDQKFAYFNGLDESVGRAQVTANGWRCIWVHAGVDWERSYETGIASKEEFDNREFKPRTGPSYTRAELKSILEKFGAYK